MEMSPVESSNIKAIGFDGDTGTMHVQFTNDRTYEYTGVTPDFFNKFASAESKGRFFAQQIKPRFTGTIYVPPKEEPTPVSEAELDRIAMSQGAARDIQE
jgi:hypothetical protein